MRRIPLLLAFLVGCSGSGSVPVTGVVTVKGKPIAGATVVFASISPKPGDTPAVAITADDGSFSLRTQRPGGDTAVGVEPGEYRVTVSKFVPPDHLSEAEYQKKVDAAASGVYSATSAVPPKVESLPKSHSDPNATILRFTAKAGGSNHFPIEIP